MPIGRWDPSLETGNEIIDNQHRDVVRLLDVLKNAARGPESEVLTALDEVLHFALFHFHAEEDLMTDVGYPAVSAQEMLRQHDDFKAYGRLRVLEFRTGAQLSVLPLHDYLEQFLEFHEFGLDRGLAAWIREEPAVVPEPV